VLNSELTANEIMKKWDLELPSKIFSTIELEPKYSNLSRKAIRKLLPKMKDGVFYMNAIEQVYGVKEKIEIRENLPPLFLKIKVKDKHSSQKVVKHIYNVKPINNPCVIRSLTELRKVVNALISKYGKPDRINIELARELKTGKKNREQIMKMIDANTVTREKAKKIYKDIYKKDPSSNDVLKVLLWEECNRICPYTGKSINFNDLFGPIPKFDIDHIIPYSRCLDDSFNNKTLCEVEQNRNVKKNMSPWEAYHGTEYDEIIELVKRFKLRSKAVQEKAQDEVETDKEKSKKKKGQEITHNEKLRRFCLTTEQINEELEDFSARQLNDTQYTATLACDFAKQLYGTDWEKHLKMTKGGVTAKLRSVWGLNKILGGDGGEKTRSDHRHHAIDAIVIALTNQSNIQMLSLASQYPNSQNSLFDRLKITEPWVGFTNDVNTAIRNVIVSHMVDRKINGQLHEESFYGFGKDENGAITTDYAVITKPLSALRKSWVDHIIDPNVRELVKLRIIELEKLKKEKKATLDDEKDLEVKEDIALEEEEDETLDPKQEKSKSLGLFKDESSLPYMVRPDGTIVKIRKVRLRFKRTTIPVGEGTRQRNVTIKSNHHIEIFEVSNKKGEKKWDGVVVSQLDAQRRHAKNEPVIQKDHGEGKKFVCSLVTGDIIELEHEGRRKLFRIRSVETSKRLSFVSINDARMQKEIKASGDWLTGRLEPLRKLNCIKVYVDPIGKVTVERSMLIR
jgi:CRISPR-associated endonuclease Csn1